MLDANIAKAKAKLDPVQNFKAIRSLKAINGRLVPTGEASIGTLQRHMTNLSMEDGGMSFNSLDHQSSFVDPLQQQKPARVNEPIVKGTIDT